MTIEQNALTVQLEYFDHLVDQNGSYPGLLLYGSVMTTWLQC